MNIMPYDTNEWTYEKYVILHTSKDMDGLMDLIA